MHEETPDAVNVDVWLTLNASDTSSMTADGILRLFVRAIDAIWREAQEVLGEVTLTAIASRVLLTSKERFPGLTGITVEGDGFSFDTLWARVNSMPVEELKEPLRFLLIELLRVLGDLTGNVLTPWLHAELAKVALQEPAPADAADQSVRMPVVSTEGEES